VDEGSAADLAGLQSGDYILEVNGESVINATHERTVSLMKQGGDKLLLKVVTVTRRQGLGGTNRGLKSIHSASTPALTNPSQCMHYFLTGIIGSQYLLILLFYHECIVSTDSKYLQGCVI